MRQAIVVITGILIGELAASLATDDTPEQSTKQMIALYDLLLVRTRDANAHVRQKTLQVLADIATLEGTKLQTHRIAVTKAAVTRLSDVRVAVRRAAIQLLIKLVETHPWAAIHGGPMKFTEWDEGYQKSVAELQKLEEQVGKVVERDGEDEEADQEGEGDEDGADADQGEQSIPLYGDEEEEDDDGESTPKKSKK
jgi:condensin complex subunit 1